MRDFLLSEALKRLSADAAVRLSGLVAAGEQIPFDVAQREGPDALFYRYEPLTACFVLEREEELRALPSFVPARDAVAAAGVAAPYLESCGEQVPADPRERAAKMLVVFLTSLWEGCTEFSLDRERLDRALAALAAEASDPDEGEVLIAPLAGLRMSQQSLELAADVRVIRADLIEAPVEAMRSEGMERASWEPQFLAVAEQEDGSDSATSALRRLRELVSVMRIFKAGGVALGPFAFAPAGEGHWSRVPTGVPAARPGGYRLSEEEAERLAGLARALEARPDPDGAISWAIGRFEMGCARESALEGLSDHILALRAVLDGQGPVGASLPMRAAALIAGESGDRIDVRGRIDEALALERSLMAGAPARGGEELAAWVEEGVRDVLRRAALGELGDDLSAAAEETLIATGLDSGDVEIAVAVHDPPELPGSEAEDISVDGEGPACNPDLPAPAYNADFSEEDHMDDQDTRILEPVPAEEEIRIRAGNWLDEVSVEEGTLEWTAAEGGVGDRERIDSPRVKHLFPVPDDADWEVRELDYDHYRRRTG
jgi:hypothetical protein